MRCRIGLVGLVAGLLLGGCGGQLGERVPAASAPEDMRRITYEIVARDGRCEPTVLAADRDGRALLITFQVTSVGRSSYFLVPEAGIRKEIPPGAPVEIPWVADRSGIYQFACSSTRWIGPFTSTGKLAVK